MPRIIQAYDGNSALGDALGKWVEAAFGDQAKNEVYRQTAFGKKRENDNMEPFAAALRDNNSKEALYRGVLSGSTGQNFGDYNRARAAVHSGGNVDSPDLATAFMGAGGSFSGTAPGQGRALANDRFTNAATNATSERNNVRTNDTHRDIELTRDGRATQGVLQPDGSVVAYTKSEANAQHLPMPQGTDQFKAGTAQMLMRRAREGSAPPASPFTTGAPAWNASAPAAAPQQPAAPPPGTVNAGMYGKVTPQEAAFIGQSRQAMINPRDGTTGYSYDGGATLSDGRPAAGFVPASENDVLAAERANSVRKSIRQPLPPRPEGYSNYAMDAGKAAGLDSVAQKVVNEVGGLFGAPEIGSGYNSARNNLNNTNQIVTQLMESAPGAKAAVAREKAANRLLPTPNFLGMTGMSGDTQKHQADDVIGALRERYALVKSEADDPTVQPAELAEMQKWLHRTREAIVHMESGGGAAPAAAPDRAAAPTAGAQAAPAAKPAQVIQNGHTYNLQPDGSYQ